MDSPHHRTRTLWLCGILHAFTHLYHVALMPLYLLIQNDLKLQSVEQATVLVTVMMLAYYLPSYPMGILADKASRKKLLGWGLAINGLGFVGLASAHTYASALFCVALAGFGGSFYHPAATALVARLCPANTGKALGLVAIGASAGFFFSPLYAGWRAAATGSWRTPIFELGLLGVVMAAVFMGLADESPPATPVANERRSPEKLFPSAALWVFFIGASLAFSLRDFAGGSMGTLGSLFLQQVHGYDPKVTGLALSCIFLVSAVSNPLFGGLSDRGRMRWACFVLIAAAAVMLVFPRMPKPGLIPTLAVYGFFFLSNYPMVEAALMESVPDAVRGRVFGFFITIGGMVGNLAHWVMGTWVKSLGPAATEAASYYPIYGSLALLVVVSLAGLPCLHAIRKREGMVE